MDYLEKGQNKMALNAPDYKAIEVFKEDLGWSNFSAVIVKSTVKYKVKLKRMNDVRQVGT